MPLERGSDVTRIRCDADPLWLRSIRTRIWNTVEQAGYHCDPDRIPPNIQEVEAGSVLPNYPGLEAGVEAETPLEIQLCCQPGEGLDPATGTCSALPTG